MFTSGPRYWTSICRRALKSTLKWGKQQVFGFLIARAILSLHIRCGVVTEHGIRGSWLSLLWPYAAAFGFVYLAQVVATIRKIQEEMESEIGSLKAALSQLGAKLDRLLPRLRFQGLGSAVKHRPNTTLHNIIVGNENHAIVNSATNVRATVSYQYGDGHPFTFGGAWVVVPTNDEVLAVSIEGGKFQRFVFLLQHETKFFCPELMGG